MIVQCVSVISEMQHLPAAKSTSSCQLNLMLKKVNGHVSAKYLAVFWSYRGLQIPTHQGAPTPACDCRDSCPKCLSRLLDDSEVFGRANPEAVAPEKLVATELPWRALGCSQPARVHLACVESLSMNCTTHLCLCHNFVSHCSPITARAARTLANDA